MYALVLTAAPVTIANTLGAVTFSELRTKDNSGELTWLWARVNTGTY